MASIFTSLSRHLLRDVLADERRQQHPDLIFDLPTAAVTADTRLIELEQRLDWARWQKGGVC